MSGRRGTPLRTRTLLRPVTLIYFYRRRLRAHGAQEALAGVGIAVAVALVLAAGVTQGSIAASTRAVLRTVIGPANLQVRARGSDGFPEALVADVEAIPGVRRAAPLLERSVQVTAENGRSTTVYLAGADSSLGVLNGLGRTLPLEALSSGTIALSAESAARLDLSRADVGHAAVTVFLGGAAHTLGVSALLGAEAVGALARAQVGVMALTSLQSLVGQPGAVTRILVQTDPGQRTAVAQRLRALAGPRLSVSGSEQDVALLRQALRPSEQASDLFAIIGALLGFLLAFNAILLTVPERRQAIADLRLSGTRRSAIVQLTLFQGLCLGLMASAFGLVIGYVLSRWVFHESTGYLAEAFTLAPGTVVAAQNVAIAGGGGVLVTCLASATPLLDLRGSRPRDAIHLGAGVPGDALSRRAQRSLLAIAIAIALLAIVLYAAAPSAALLASVALALATVLAVPVAFAAVLAGARALSGRAPRLATLAIALGGVRGTTLRSIALAATGAVALFGSVALGGARANLLSGIRGFAHSYAADAPVWVGEPGDNQATGRLAGDGGAARIARLPGVASVRRFQGAFLTLGPRRVWVIARPPGGANGVLASQTIGGARAAALAERRLAQGGWVALSQQIASERHTRIGSRIVLPTPAGAISYRVAALTSNLAWSPGVIFIGADDFSRAWQSRSPSALAVLPRAGVSAQAIKREITASLGPSSGIEVATAADRQAKIDALTAEGLDQLGIISTLLVLAAILALAAALASSINQRRVALAGLRLAGAPPARLRRILLVEAALMLSAGCVTGALVGVFGQFVIDAYLRHVTGFPVSSAGASVRPVEVFVLVLATALAAVAIPAWLASKVSPALALTDE
jgi:putative ABC transport system permease protein